MQHLQREDRGVHVQVRVFLGLDGERRERVGSCLGVFTGKLELFGSYCKLETGVTIPFAHKALPALFWECCVCSGGAMSKQCD